MHHGISVWQRDVLDSDFQVPLLLCWQHPSGNGCLEWTLGWESGPKRDVA